MKLENVDTDNIDEVQHRNTITRGQEEKRPEAQALHCRMMDWRMWMCDHRRINLGSAGDTFGILLESVWCQFWNRQGVCQVLSWQPHTRIC